MLLRLSTLRCHIAVIFMVYLRICRSTPLPEISAGGTCAGVSECDTGYICNEPYCIRQNCSAIVCDASDTRQVCGTTAIVYPNKCEMKKKECELMIAIHFIKYGQCNTLPPPTTSLCGEAQRVATTNLCELLPYNEADVTLELLTRCTYPTCHNKLFSVRQCHRYQTDWCWCSTKDGQPINGTHQRNMLPGTCDTTKKCTYGGKKYLKGAKFYSLTGCGFCYCLENGETKCYEDYHEGNQDLSDKEKLLRFKRKAIEMFVFQNSNRHQPNFKVDLHILCRFPQQVRNSTKLLEEKFMEYDRKNNLFLTGTDKFELRVVFFDLTWCLKYVNYFARSMGAHVDKAAWLNFFSDPAIYTLTDDGCTDSVPPTQSGSGSGSGMHSVSGSSTSNSRSVPQS